MKRQFYLRWGLLVAAVLALSLSACGPVIVTSRPGPPPPPWFYPNRLEVVRYVYFPELSVYFDLRTHVYLYREGNVWVRRPQLPPRYRNYDLGRQRYERIRGYQEDNIAPYHRENSGRSNRSRTPPRNQL